MLVGHGNYAVTVSTALNQIPKEITSIAYDPNNSAPVTVQQFREGLGNNSEDIYETEIIKGEILYDYKKGSGAYYIAYSPFRDDYSRITSYVRLPTFIETNDGKRDAFISFGIQGQYGYIDMGIMNSGKGWKPYHNDNGDLISFDDKTAKEDVKIMGLNIQVESKKKVKLAYI